MMLTSGGDDKKEGDDRHRGTHVAVHLGEGFITPDLVTGEAGDVEIKATNKGYDSSRNRRSQDR